MRSTSSRDWPGRAARASTKTAASSRTRAHPLYTREKIEPHLFVKQLQAGGDIHQGSMFEAFNGLPEEARSTGISTKANWQNRLIHGESARVMASLPDGRTSPGRCRMIYFDPPYGMSYKSNFQVAVDDRGHIG